ncbi:tetratricopeptide repeat protein [Methylobrevis albus]|uniref:Tetratricopeptide repeat protein n=1 Tax=Methylobrevis albus TaxID=2793297 RepID=A0A931MYI2_9HYPH|nr:tetratricopeptide repeat protein [Methylobrevis albus]MBH0238447.1 tetratricopeptide repeat protein [Methylobrevis albus]
MRQPSARLPLLRALPRTAAVACVLAATLLGGCALNRGPAIGTHGGPTITSSSKLTDAQLAQATQAWGQRYDKNPGDRATILNYAAALRLSGQTDQAVAVLQKGMIAFKKDRAISASYGKALAANGDFEQALTVIRSAQTPDRPDWALLSAEGAILDQVGQGNAARQLYAKALGIVPEEPSVLNNMGLSYLLAGELTKSEEVLRRAAAQPKATSRIRQNLALVLGLQGRFAEAEAVASNELDPQQAAANVAYLKSMMTQANTWKDIESSEKKRAG